MGGEAAKARSASILTGEVNSAGGAGDLMWDMPTTEARGGRRRGAFLAPPGDVLLTWDRDDSP